MIYIFFFFYRGNEDDLMVVIYFKQRNGQELQHFVPLKIWPKTFHSIKIKLFVFSSLRIHEKELGKEF